MENLTDRIQDYIDGLLEGAELQQFEQRMEEDQELRDLVELQKEVHEIISRRIESGEDELRENIARARANIATAPKSNKVFKMYIPIAAAACLLAVFGLFLFRGGDQALYDMPIMPSEIVRGEVGNTSYEDAVKLFNEGKYSEVRAVLQPLIGAEPEVVQYQYYAALTFVGEEDWSAATSALQPLAEGRSIYADDAKYYLGLAYWKTGNTQDAIASLEQIPDVGKLGEKKVKLLKNMR